MRKERVSRAVQRALGGSRKVTVTLSPGSSAEDIYKLLLMNVKDVVRLEEHDELALLDVFASRDWRDGENTMVITFTNSFDEELFVNEMSLAIDEIEVVD